MMQYCMTDQVLHYKQFTVWVISLASSPTLLQITVAAAQPKMWPMVNHHLSDMYEKGPLLTVLNCLGPNTMQVCC